MKVFVWEIFFKPELQILSSNFLCENFFLLPFFIELQIKRVPPNPISDWGGDPFNLYLDEECELKKVFTHEGTCDHV